MRFLQITGILLFCTVQVSTQPARDNQPPQILPLPQPVRIAIPKPPKHVVPSKYRSFSYEPSIRIQATLSAVYDEKEGTMPKSQEMKGYLQDLGLPTVKEAKEPVGKHDNSMNFRIYGLDQGLSNLNIHDGIVDSLGNLWLSTGFGGVSRFDGKSFAHYGEHQGLSNNMVLGLLIDEEERIWCGTLNGLNVLDGSTLRTFYAHDGLPGNTVLEMVQDHWGCIWISSYEGVSRIDPATFEITTFRIHPSLDLDLATKLSIGPDSTIWVGGGGPPAYIKISGTEDNPVYQMYTLEIPFASRRLGGISFDTDQHIWMALGTEVFQLVREADRQFKITRFGAKQGLTGSDIDCLSFDHVGQLWIGTRAGLVVWTPDNQGKFMRYRRLGEADGLPNNYIISLFRDQHKNVWIGCNDAGLTRYRPNNFQSLTTADGLPSNRVSSILEDQQGRIWIGTLNDGIARYSRGDGGHPAFFEYFTKQTGLSQSRIYAMLEDAKGNIWIGLRHGGILKYVGESNEEEIFWLYQEGLPGDFVTDIEMDRDSNLWFAVQSLGLDRGSGICSFQNNQMIVLGIEQGLISEDTWCLTQDINRTFWLGSWGDGVTTYQQSLDEPPKIKYFTSADALGGNKIRTILNDQNAWIWVGSTGSLGLTRFSAADFSYRQFTVADGLCDNSIVSSLEAANGDIWLGGYEGISVFKEDAFVSYFAADGFQGVGCLPNAIYQTNDGLIWVGTYDRLTIFDPDNFPSSRRRPTVQLTNVKLFNESMDWGQTDAELSDNLQSKGLRYTTISPWHRVPSDLSLRHAQNFIEFDFVGISFDQYSKVRYQHRLIGLEDQWAPSSTQSTASYANLAPGKYVFEARAKIGTNQWGTPLRYALQIRPPWWFTWWALGFYILLAFGAIYLFIRLRVQRAIAKYKAVESLRLKISSDLHDDVGTTLAGIAMQSELMVRQGHNGATKQLRELSELSRAAMDQMRDIVWAMDSRRDRYQNLVDRIREYALNQVENSDFGFKMNTTGLPLDDFIPPDIRQNIYLIVKEAILNSLKHSNGNKIEVEIMEGNQCLTVVIRDNGKVNRPFAKEGLGLSNMEMRAKSLNAEFAMNQNAGFAVHLKIPLVHK